ncbi:gas vesicle protein [Streptomyces venezuelae]|uniref:gas vesicle protein n=1 Tax=Streptomyces venezuelae TaxID=54571 RepID=UPI0037CD81F1
MSVDRSTEQLPGRQVALVDLLDRLLSGGVVLSGDIVLSIADIDLVRISLRALIVSVGSEADPLGPSAQRHTGPLGASAHGRADPLGPSAQGLA